MRINIDSQWFGDPRWRLAGSLAKENPLLTRGRIENVWHYCYIQRSDTLSDDDINVQAEWDSESSFADILVKARLAEKMHNGEYRIRGVADRIHFLIQQAERGRAGAEARKRTLVDRLANAKRTPSERQASAEQPLSLSPALSPAPAQALTPDIIITTETGLARERVKERPTAGDGPKDRAVHEFIKVYAENYKAHYGVGPTLGPRNAGIAKRIVREVGLENALKAVNVYLERDGKGGWYKTKAHDLATLEGNLALLVGIAKATMTERGENDG